MTDPRACPNCGRDNAPAASFCFGCGVSLTLGALGELTHDDRQRAFDGLLETLRVARLECGGHATHDEVARELLRAHLSVFWLRPETALVQALQARVLIPELARGPEGPVLDVGCGDGIHVSLVHGWRFDESFDAYGQLDLDAADAFDAVPAAPLQVRLARAGRTIEAGVDIKPSMVARASALGTFGTVHRADATALPFADGSFARLHSNAIVHLDDRVLEPILAECARVLRPGGAAVLVSMAENYGESLHFFPRVRAARAEGRTDEAASLERLDRGRATGLLRSHTLADWERRARAAGLAVENVQRCVPPAVLAAWDTGWRPFAPQLVPWAETLRGGAHLGPVKRGVVGALEWLLGPLVDGPETCDDGTTRVVRLVKP